MKKITILLLLILFGLHTHAKGMELTTLCSNEIQKNELNLKNVIKYCGKKDSLLTIADVLGKTHLDTAMMGISFSSINKDVLRSKA